MKYIILPIEPLDSRYSTQWKKWFADYFDMSGLDYIMVDPVPLTNSIEKGAFLDFVGTNYYKSAQLQEVCKLIYNGHVDKDTVFLLHDAWFPGIEMLAYIRDGLKVPFKIAGCLHAGSYDKTDVIAKLGMGIWAKDLENSWMKLYDHLFVATKYHKKVLLENRKVDEEKIHVSGFPMYLPEIEKCKKQNVVVFPHRLNDDKQPELFLKLTYDLLSKFPNWAFIRTQDLNLNKSDFYSLLNKSTIAVSFATHEMWGIGMQEAVHYGCIPIVPNRLSYVEMYSNTFKYSETYEECRSLVTETILAIENNGFDVLLQELATLRSSFEKTNKQAIPNMVKELV